MRRSVIVLCSLALAACAQTSGTVEIPPDELPFPVARKASPSGSPGSTQQITVYFTMAGRLHPASRAVALDVPVAEASMRALVEGPTADERADGIRTELGSAVGILSVVLRDGSAIVDLSGEFQEPATPKRVALRVAQVTWTLTDIAEVSSVAFAIDGEAVSVATDSGESVDRPVSRADFSTFAPLR